ncbi:hypothetical protein, partial [Streptococcus suis]|uniref:hypothetical protein n=1 Tax=Streptococcus suis TaxID=1307 RepID=UPI001E4B34B4
VVVQANGYFYFTPFFDVCKHFIFRGASAPHPEEQSLFHRHPPNENIFLFYFFVVSCENLALTKVLARVEMNELRSPLPVALL